tara:strand:- start:194 stop:643 length:450 start_codon:yes stop_codon:yes gene_type:complete
MDIVEWMDECYRDKEKRDKIIINCVIYNNLNIKNNKTTDTFVYYKGQKKGRKDSLIKSYSTLYLERRRNKEYNYIGLVTNVEKINDYPINEFKLTIDKNYIHNEYQSGDILHYVESLRKGKGSYWSKRSSLIKLGFKDKGNMAEGIISV